MSVITVSGAQFYYELHGQGQPVVLIAGMMGDHGNWLPVLQQFAEHYQVLVFDNRGTGQTKDDGSSFTADTLAEDVIHLVEALHLPRPYIIGHSLGGAVAQVLAKKYADKISSVVLCNTLMKASANDVALFGAISVSYKEGKSAADILAQLAPYVFSKSFLTPEFMAFLREVTQANPYPQTLQGFERQFACLRAFDSRSWISTIKVPALVIASSEDAVISVEQSKEIADKISDGRFEVLKTGHASFVEMPDAFFQLVDNYFNHKA